MGQGGDGGGCSPPQIFEPPIFGGWQEKFGRSQFLKTFSCFFFLLLLFFYFFFMFHEFFIFIIILLFFMFLKF